MFYSKRSSVMGQCATWLYGAIFLCTVPFVFSSQALAWEFNLASTTTFQYNLYTQNNANGFFGKPNIDNGSGWNFPPPPTSVFHADFANSNAWLGVQVNNLVSGSDASYSYFTTYSYPEIRVNPAIKLEGAYRVGNSDTATNPGVTVAWTVVDSLWWSINFESPLGRFTYGKRPFIFGCGLQYDANNRSEEYFTLASQFGPLTIGAGLYPWRRAYTVQENNNSNPYWNIYDKSGIPHQDFFGFVKYAGGSLEMGFGGTLFSYRWGPEGTVLTDLRAKVPGLQVSSSEGWIYCKYNDGRFFFNTEADWQYRTATYARSMSGDIGTTTTVHQNTDGSGSIFRPQYTEWWRWMVEMGVIAGPSKVSLLYAYIPGPDRRHGVLIDRQPVLTDIEAPNADSVVFLAQQSNADMFRPYSLLLSAAYGGGLLAQNPGIVTPHPVGYMVDASILAARIDYSVASNLNVYASFLYANRASNSGWGWGSIYPSSMVTLLGAPYVVVQSNRNFTEPIPSIPDNNLGWEFNTGMDWQLLQNLLTSVYVGYWQPGKWFNFACIDRSVPDWNTPTSANSWGISPDRTINPVFGFNWTMTCTF